MRTKGTVRILIKALSFMRILPETAWTVQTEVPSVLCLDNKVTSGNISHFIQSKLFVRFQTRFADFLVRDGLDFFFGVFLFGIRDFHPPVVLRSGPFYRPHLIIRCSSPGWQSK